MQNLKTELVQVNESITGMMMSRSQVSSVELQALMDERYELIVRIQTMKYGEYTPTNDLLN